MHLFENDHVYCSRYMGLAQEDQFGLEKLLGIGICSTLMTERWISKM